jgi:hypothetical protein
LRLVLQRREEIEYAQVAAVNTLMAEDAAESGGRKRPH